MGTNKTNPRSAREAAGLRQVDVASKAGVSLQTVVRCEREVRWPRSLPVLRAYLAALGLTESDVTPRARRVSA